jgi:hypothetical protein
VSLLKQRDRQLRQCRGGHWSNVGFTRPDRQVVGQHIDKNKYDHQHRHDPDSPISMCMPQIVLSRVLVVPKFGSLAFDIVFAHAHFVPASMVQLRCDAS